MDPRSYSEALDVFVSQLQAVGSPLVPLNVFSSLLSTSRVHGRRQQLTAELEPTKEQLRIANAELEARNAQVQLLEDESRKWQERNAQLLTKVSCPLLRLEGLLTSFPAVRSH